MMKRRLAILFTFIAYSILLLHSLVPHHHEEDAHSVTKHIIDHHSDEPEGDIDDDFLANAFSHLQHEQGPQISYLSEDNVLKEHPEEYTSHVILKSALYDNLAHWGHIQKSVFLSVEESPPDCMAYASSCLRGPPSFI